MTDQAEIDFEGIEQQPLAEFTEKAYLDYSMFSDALSMRCQSSA
jgi:DNA gyrase/topoisomerase IV subunit A